MSIQVAIMMGSKNDLPVLDEAAKILKEFGVEHEIKVLSAHRTPKETAEYVEQLKSKGVKVSRSLDPMVRGNPPSLRLSVG